MAQNGSPFACKTGKAQRNFLACDEENEKARIGTFALVEKGIITAAMLSDPAAFLTALLAAELACTAYVYREVSGAYDGGSPVTGRAGGRLKEKTVGKAHTATIGIFDYVGNEDHWESNEGRAREFDAFFFTESRVWPVMGTDLGITVVPPISDDPDLDIEATVTLRWNKKGLLKSYPADVAGVDVKPFIPFTGLSNGDGSTGTIDGETVTVANSGAVDIIPAFTGADTYRAKPGSDFPAWLSVNAAGHLVGTAPATDTTVTVGVQAQTGCGILGEVMVTIVVA